MAEAEHDECRGGSPIRDGYDRWAAIYDHDANPLPPFEEPLVRTLAGEVAGLDALDLGCGTGRHALWLALAGARVTAIDFSPRMLAEARAKPGAEAVRFMSCDLHDPLPFADGSFDLVVSGLVLEHITALGDFFGQARRVLRPSGRMIVSAMHPAMFLRGSKARFTDPATGELVEPGSLAHGLGEIVMAAVRAGLQPDQIGEHRATEELAARYPRAARYVGWPMLLVLRLVLAPQPQGAGQ